MTIPIIASAIRALWLVGEILHQRGQQVKLLKNLDRNSGRLWDVANAIEPVGMILGFAGIGRIQTGSGLVAGAGLALLILGILIRWMIDRLERFPLMARHVPERSREDLRELIKPPYRIVYRVSEVVKILTIFRASRLFPSQLK